MCASRTCPGARVSVDRVAGEAGELRDDSLRFVLEAARLGWWDMDLVTGQTVRSAGHDALFGYSSVLPSWGYHDFLAHIYPEDRARVDAAYQAALAGGKEYAEELRVVWPDGTLRWVFTRGRFVLGIDGTPVRVAGVMGDITERKLRELGAVEQMAAAHAVLASTGDAVVGSTLDGVVLSWNDGAERLYGWSAEQAIGRSLSVVLACRHDAQLQQAVASVGRATTHDLETEHVRPDGSFAEVGLTVSPVRRDGRCVGASVIGRDIGLHRSMQRALAHQATHDELTGLPNRSQLADNLHAGLARALARNKPEPMALLFLDLDEFKLVNDAAGHLVGDRLLVEVGRRLRAALREVDTLARFGGDEFVAVCWETNLSEALELAERLRLAVKAPVEIDGGQFYPSLSIGVAHGVPDPSATPVEVGGLLLRQADTAMYEAKERGRDRTSVFDEVLAERAREVVALTKDLRAAMQTGLIELWYQPVIDLTNGELLGVEALARWQHPERGAVPPHVFIAAADRSGLITVLDQWVVRRASYDAALLRSLGALPAGAYCAVNVSARTVADGLLPATVLHGALGPELEHLVLEVTETGMTADSKRSRADLLELQRHGVRISIDDFGTGQSSLTYLRSFPISVLKIDCSFVQGMATSHEDLAIVRSVVSLALETGLDAVAEGVEDEVQLVLLREMGCPAGQGFYWTPALPLQAFLQWAARRRVDHPSEPGQRPPAES